MCRSRVRWLVACALLACAGVAPGEPATEEPRDVSTSCSYETFRWNVQERRATGRRLIVKSRDELQAAEVDAATGCTVCREDQVEIRLEGLSPFRMCRRLAARTESALRALQSQGVPLRTVVGYRVGMTRGGTDARGERTRFSNHSFGIALDINEAHNGLYSACAAPGPGCRLRRGGLWVPDRDPLSMTATHPVVLAMEAAGFRWGGALAGDQKDFMHFSPAGD